MSRQGFRLTKLAVARGLLLGAGVALAPIVAHAQTASLTNLGTLGGVAYGNYSSEACCGYNISNDGSVVVGDAITAGGQDNAFRWTQGSGMVDIDTTGTGSNSYSSANAVSADGSVVVGGANFGNAGGNQNAFRWTQGTGMVDIDTTGTGSSSSSYAYAVSADGSVVVGGANFGNAGGNQNAFRWTQGTGMVDIDTTGTGSSSSSYAGAVSADGSVVVGGANFGNAGGNYNAFRWTQGTGMVDIDTTGTGSSSSSFASAVSADGSVVVGGANFGNAGGNYTAFRWTQGTGMVDIDTTGTGSSSSSFAYAVSATGKVVVGRAYFSTNGGVNDAFRWTQATGMQDLNTLLAHSGVNMSGIQLQYALGISQNGEYISGYGLFSGIDEAYLVYYNDGTVDGLVTPVDLQTSINTLASDQRAALAESHATAGELLGMTRPMDETSYTYAGSMFGSALAYTGGQYSSHGVTLLGGIAYGAQDYPDLDENNAPTAAFAARYTFNDPFPDKAEALHPFAEAGGWVTPQQGVTLTRSYADGTGTSMGEGTSEATSWAGYGRAGMVWNATAHNSFTGFGELGQQTMDFSGYTEATTASNPFPATVSGGTLRMDVARYGGQWTHSMDGLFFPGHIPATFTLAADYAQSFDVRSGLTAEVPGIGTSAAANTGDRWAEFGARLESHLTERLALDLDVTGTSGDNALRTAIHGGGGLSYSF